MRTQSPSRIYTVSAAKTISTGTHAMSGRGKKKSESLKYNYSVHSPIYNENIIKMLCFFPRPAEEGWQNYGIFRHRHRHTAKCGLPERRVKAVRKINPYRLQAGGENTITPIVLCTGGGQQSFCIYYYYYYYQFSGRTNIIKWSLSLFLSVCPSLLRCV